MTENINGKFVTVGEFIGTELEYLPEQEGDIYSQDGKLYASISGTLQINPRKRTAIIKTDLKSKRPTIISGDIVIGRVQFERKFTVGIKILKVGKKLLYNMNKFGNIHISNVSTQYIKNLEDAFKSTDIIRGKIIEMSTDEYEISTEGYNLGVIACNCPICGQKMLKKREDLLICPFCGKEERRKIAKDYENIIEQIQF
ncbi:MAG: exosome complex RNA-binding protein Csl4 [Promethearchaeota archaeon]